MPFSPKAILHIGAEKTGTTSIQSALAGRREHLNARGFHYPTFAGDENHFRLASYAQDDGVFDDLRIFDGVRNADDLARFRDTLEHAAEEELSRHAGRVLIFSNEHCQSRLPAVADVKRLREFLERFAEKVEICLYLRRQDRLAVSRYSTIVKHGAGGDILEQEDIPESYWDFDALLDRWARVFGREAIRVEVCEREWLAGGSVVTDFARAYGLGLDVDDAPRRNTALSGPGTQFLRELNRRVPAVRDGEYTPERDEIVRIIQEKFPGGALRPSRARAQAFLARQADSNERVRRKWFPDRRDLFDDDFSNYPDTEPEDQSRAEIFAIFAVILQELQRNHAGSRSRLEPTGEPTGPMDGSKNVQKNGRRRIASSLLHRLLARGR